MPPFRSGPNINMNLSISSASWASSQPCAWLEHLHWLPGISATGAHSHDRAARAQGFGGSAFTQFRGSTGRTRFRRGLHGHQAASQAALAVLFAIHSISG